MRHHATGLGARPAGGTGRPATALALLVLLSSGVLAQPAPGLEGESPEAGDEATEIRILHADRAPMDRGQEQVVLEGHVRIQRGETHLSGDYLRWDRRRQSLEMRGDVVVRDRQSRLSSDHLIYDLVEDVATSWGRPRLEQGDPASQQGRVILRAIQLRLFPQEGRVEAIEDVLVEQSVERDGQTRVEMRVECRVAEVLARGKRNIFKGDVRVETPDIGARAGRMLYEQESRRVYLLDGAQVWNYDSGGGRLDELTGDKIIYFLDEGRTIALGGVRAAVHPEATPGRRSLTRSRRLPLR